MKTRVFILSNIIAICLIAIVLFGFKNASTNYQHLIIVSEGVDLERVLVSIDGKEFIRHKDLKKQHEGDWDINPVINLIHKYESEGWVLQSATPNNATVLYWLRREK